MKSFIRSLSAPAEFYLVLLIGFGVMIFRVVWETGMRLAHAPRQAVSFSDVTLCGLFIYELLVLAAVLWIGRNRGWSLKTFGFQVSWKWTGLGVLLYVLTVIAYTLAVSLPSRSSPSPPLWRGGPGRGGRFFVGRSRKRGCARDFRGEHPSP